MVFEVGLATDLAIILLSATLVGFIAKQTGQPTIIAYIIAGVVIGPAALGIVEITELTETLSELGLAFLLFLLGIKMRLDEIRHVLAPIVKIAIPQMMAVAIVGTGISLLLGFTMIEAVLIGLAVMYSSTAVVIKLLNDKDEATSLHGKIDVGILLVQDIVVVILLARSTACVAAYWLCSLPSTGTKILSYISNYCLFIKNEQKSSCWQLTGFNQPAHD